MAASTNSQPRFLYAQEPLVMTADSIRDTVGSFSLAMLPNPEPKCPVRLQGNITPLTERLWKIALDDAENNMVTSESGTIYFGAGSQYGLRIYERDIAVSGVLGLNHFYPKVMLSSLKVARESRKELGYKVSAPHVVPEIDFPWEVAIQKEFTKPDGTLAYYKDRHGKLMLNRSGYATAFAVIFGIVEGEAAKAAYAGFPTPDNGIPLFFPFIENTEGSVWHNQASWPFCDTFLLWGKSISDGKDYTDLNAALLARSIGTAIKPKKAKEDQAEADAFGSFHEYVTLPDGLIHGSGRQLWTAAAFLNVCIRAGLVGPSETETIVN